MARVGERLLERLSRLFIAYVPLCVLNCCDFFLLNQVSAQTGSNTENCRGDEVDLLRPGEALFVMRFIKTAQNFILQSRHL